MSSANRGYLAVLGGNLMACPALERLKQLGYRLLVLDGNPEAPARDIAEVFRPADFSKLDAAREALSGFNLEGIMPINDFGVKTASVLSRELGLPGWSEQAMRCFTSKVAMKRAWQSTNLATPRCAFASADDIMVGKHADWEIFPCIIKPSFSGGGSRGVILARDWEDARVQLAPLKARYLDGDAVLEEFIDGSEHTIEVLVHDGEPHLLSISDKVNYPSSVTVVQNLYFPGPIGNAHRDVLQPLVYAACRAMGLRNGTTHFEVMLRDGQAFLLEVGGRPGGGLNFHPICELSTGHNYPALYAAVLTGRVPEFARQPAQNLAWHYFNVGRGVLKAIHGFDEVRAQPDVVDACIYEAIGEPRLDIRDDLARPGYILVKAESHEKAKQRAAALCDSVHFEVEPAPQTSST